MEPNAVDNGNAVAPVWMRTISRALIGWGILGIIFQFMNIVFTLNYYWEYIGVVRFPHPIYDILMLVVPSIFAIMSGFSLRSKKRRTIFMLFVILLSILFSFLRFISIDNPVPPTLASHTLDSVYIYFSLAGLVLVTISLAILLISRYRNKHLFV